MSTKASTVEDRAQQGDRSRLVERLVAVAALGRLHAARAPPGARTALDDSAGRLQVAATGGEAELGDPDAAREAVIDDDRGPPCVGLERGRHPAHVPAVADGEQRQDADAG